MRFLVWVCRLIMLVVGAAFAATVFYVTHDVGTQMDSALTTLELVTVIGAGVLGFMWPLMRRYWQAFALLLSLAVFRVFFGLPELVDLDLQSPLLTTFQDDYLWISIGVVALMLVVTLVTRAVTSDRKIREIKAAGAAATLIPPIAAAEPPAQVQTPTAVSETPVAVAPVPDAPKGYAEVDEPTAVVPAATEEAAPASERKRKK